MIVVIKYHMLEYKMLQIKNLTVSLTKDLRTIIDNFSFTLNDGEKAVVIGEEGNGKSTLLKLIYEPSLVAGYAEYTGSIITHGTRFGYLSQEFSDVEKARQISDYFTTVSGFYDMTPRELAQTTFQLGLPTELYYSEQKVGTLSGGERVKLQLLKILIEKPEVLLLDEPSNDIDIETLEWLESFINTCALPVMFVSHDETLIENTANVIIHIEQVRRKTMPRCTVAKMPYKEYIDIRMHKLARQEQAARKEQSEYEAKLERFRKIQQKVEHEQETISRGDPHGGRLLKKKMKAVKSLEHRIERESDNMTQLPDVEEAIFVKFDGGVAVPNGRTILDLTLESLVIDDRTIARYIHLNVTGPEKICIIGRNGIGKTTLLKLISQELMARRDIKCAYMPQNYEELLDMTQTPIVFLGRTGEKTEKTRIRSFLGSMKYTSDEMEHKIAELSGGQKAKLMFLKMILDGCNVLLLDEPTRNFSPISNPVIRDVLKSFGGAIISISHDRKYIHEVCSRVYRMTEEGLAVERG
jgi:ATPase subunit of ABC transporter with duplicated ATPase domains